MREARKRIARGSAVAKPAATCAYVSIRQHTSAYVSIRQRGSAVGQPDATSIQYSKYYIYICRYIYI
jgi:hypothetical protein